MNRDTICVQGGYTPGNGEPRQIPIIQSTTFKYATSEDMGKLFDLEADGYFYSRLQNPTCDLVAKKICELEPDAHVYRCGADEFIVIFPAAEKGASFARVDNIRRTVAASEFLLSGRKKALKLTVSCSVADKKRSDADVFEVFMRARKILQKTYKFTQNITSQA